MNREPGSWLTPEMRSTIKGFIERNHGVVPDDDDINWISAAEESRVRIEYQTRIIRRLEMILVRRSQTTDRNHRASELLAEANGCYRDGRYYACILVSRAAVEAALKTTIGKENSLGKLIAQASARGLLDERSAEMAQSLRIIGNEFAHHDQKSILDREEARVDRVEFVVEQPPEGDLPALETWIKENAAAPLLAFKAYQYAVRICEKLIPPNPRPPSARG